MKRKKGRKGPAANVSPSTRAKAQARAEKLLTERSGRAPGGTPPERVQRLFSGTAQLAKEDKAAAKARAEQERSEVSKARRAASSTTPGPGRPRLGGKSRGTRGRLTKGS